MKKRADILLTEKGLCASREKAKRTIMAGLARADGRRIENPSAMIDVDAECSVVQDECPYVSRGGWKLKKAIDSFKLELHDSVCVDIGASTGGFTDCMLQAGAQFVYAVDVGYGQFDWKLRNDRRVCLLERTNARYLDQTQIPKVISFASIDVSFISLRLILPVFDRLALADDFSVAALIKPQFEAGREKVGKKGVVRDPAIHAEVIGQVWKFAGEQGFSVQGLTYSPVKGPNGNIEFLILLKKGAGGDPETDRITNVVTEAHKMLV